MEANCAAHVQKYHQCQVHGDMKHMSPMPLHTMTSPWPFSTWGIDIIGKIHPTTSNGYEFILVAIDYFTKWVEAISYKVLNSKKVSQFIQWAAFQRGNKEAAMTIQNSTPQVFVDTLFCNLHLTSYGR